MAIVIPALLLMIEAIVVMVLSRHNTGYLGSPCA